MFCKRFFPLLLILLLPAVSGAYQQLDFVHEFGEYDKKTRQRQLNGPRAIALAGQKIFIADTEAHRVVVLDPQGRTILAWGSKGDKPGQFRSPAGIAVDEAGLVYVADTGNHRIQVFDQEGKPVRAFGSKGDNPRELHSPSGLAARHGHLYIGDTGNSRVQILSTDGIFIREIQVAKGDNEMKEPVAIAVDGQNRIYVLDSESNRVTVFDSNGVQLTHFGSKGKGGDGFMYPRGLSVAAGGSIYVTDTGNYKLKKFDSQGKLLASVGSEGNDPRQFREASGLVVDRDGKVYVLDAEKHSLQVFTSEAESEELLPLSPPAAVALVKDIAGEVSVLAGDKRVWSVAGDAVTALGVRAGRTIGTRGSDPGKFRNPAGLALDNTGKFWIVDSGNDRLQKFSIEGTLLQVIGKTGSGEGQFDDPSGLAIGPKGNLYIADTGNSRVQVFNSKGTFLGMFGKRGKQAGQLSEPVDIAVDRNEQVYVADRGNNRIAKFDAAGALIWEIGKYGGADGEFRGPSNLLVSPDNELYVLDSGNCRVQVFDRNGKFIRKFGSRGRGPGEFRDPQGMTLVRGVELYIGDRGNARVQVFTVRHTPETPKEVTAQARANEVQVGWKSNNESYFEKYQVYRSEAQSGPYTLIGNPSDPFFQDKDLPSNKSFFYRVASRAREGNESAPSAAVSAVTPRLVPDAPKKVRVEAIEKQVTISWLPNLEPFVTHYNVYRTKQIAAGFELLAKAEHTMFMDRGLTDETVYYYQIKAVGREGDESVASEVVVASTPKAALTVPPLEIAAVDSGLIFASAYKYYESHALGKVTVRNNTDAAFAKVKMSFSIKGFMDFPSEVEIEEVQPRTQVEVLLKPVFSNRILEVTENTPVQSEVGLTYYLAGEAKTITRSVPVTVYERHAMVWDQKDKLGAFVTPKDPPVAEFTRAVIRPYVEAYPNLHPSLVYARALYDGLGVLGLKYIIDPTSPFQQFSESAGSVDYLQYPRDTLARKSGDCDDLSVLFAASLENIGIGSAFIDVPGHVFIMFNTGVKEKDKSTLGFADQMLILHEGTVWIPLEMTMVGSSFTRAWQKAVEEYRDWSAKGKIEIVNTQKAWDTFRPVTLPSSDVRTAKVGREEIEAMFKDELEGLAAQRLANLSAEYLDTLKKNPGDGNALGQLGFLYAENGLYAEALEQFQKMLASDKNNSTALNNIGNINYLQERLEDAKIAYEASLSSSPEDAGTMANLARVLLRLGKKDQARNQFRAAASLDPRVFRQYGDLATALGVVK